MAEAPYSQCVRAMVQLPGTSGLARDNVVNTFHFWCSVLDEGNLSHIRDMLSRFYNTTAAGGSGGISAYLSTAISRGTPVLVKCYDLGDPVLHNAEGKVTQQRPLHQASFNLASAGTGLGSLPSECAVTLSYYAGQNQKRYRGRIFLGPMDRSAQGAAEQGDSRVNASLQTLIQAKASELAADASFEGVRWGLFSTTDNVVRYPITGGWCDNAWDTIRKRGLKPTARVAF
jgi:hypothetical protein